MLSERTLVEIFRNIEPNKRFSIASSIPSLQTVDRQVPLYLDFLEFQSSEFTVNSQKYQFRVLEKSKNRPKKIMEFQAIVGDKEYAEQPRNLKNSEELRTRRLHFLENFEEEKILDFPNWRAKKFPENLKTAEEEESRKFPEAIETLKKKKLETIEKIKNIKLEISKSWRKLKKCETAPSNRKLEKINELNLELEYFLENLKIIELLLYPPEIFVHEYRLRISNPKISILKKIKIENPKEFYRFMVSDFLGNRKFPISVKNLKIRGFNYLPEDVILKPKQLECNWEILGFQENFNFENMERLTIFDFSGSVPLFCKSPMTKNLNFLEISSLAVTFDEEEDQIAIAKLPIEEIVINIEKNEFGEDCDRKLVEQWMEGCRESGVSRKLKIRNFLNFSEEFLEVLKNRFETTEQIRDDGKKIIQFGLSENAEIRIIAKEGFSVYNKYEERLYCYSDIFLEFITS